MFSRVCTILHKFHSPVIDGVADVLLDAQRSLAGPALPRGLQLDHPIRGALGLR